MEDYYKLVNPYTGQRISLEVFQGYDLALQAVEEARLGAKVCIVPEDWTPPVEETEAGAESLSESISEGEASEGQPEVEARHD